MNTKALTEKAIPTPLVFVIIPIGAPIKTNIKQATAIAYFL